MKETTEESLDPENWDQMKQLGHRMVDDMMEYLRSVRERPVWSPIPEELRSWYRRQPLPTEAQGAEGAYHDFKKYVLPYPLGNIHPRFWGWITGTGTPMGMLAEMLAAGMNSNLAGFNQVPALLETQVVDWCKAMFDFPAGASGLLVSGGSMANLVGLTVARDTKAGFNVMDEGVQQSHRQLTVYGSSETHSSVEKAVQVLGLGNKSFRRVKVNKDFQIDIPALAGMLREDRAKGYQPVCVVGNAGTVNTGALDDLNMLADIAESEDLWFHVDASLGAFAALSPQLKPLVAGVERADSLAFCLHKWMYIQYEASCVLVRDSETHRKSFSAASVYLTQATAGLSAGSPWFSEFGIQLSRGFRALKIWMSIKEHGIRKYGRLVEQNVEQAQYLVSLVTGSDELELLAPAPLNIVCFRFINRQLDDAQLNQLNQDILIRLQEEGVAAPSSTMLNGRFAIRVANTNHRTRRSDFDLLVEKTVEYGRNLIEKTALQENNGR